MNNEIKEILDRLKYCKEHDEEDNYYPEDIFFKDEPYILLDYITNLQEENKAKDIQIQTLEEILNYKDKENERLKEWKKDLLNENIELENTRKEAIEYINKNKHLSMFADCREPEEDWNYDLEINPRELLNILKGEDNE